YAEARGIPLAQAKDELMGRYRDVEGTLEWYCLDHWSRELGLDIALLKQEVDHLIAVHPYVVEFLEAVRRADKRVALVTNAHQKALQLKMERTRLRGHFDRVICAHDLGLPKEDPRFWEVMQKVFPFEPERTLFVDDSISVLRSAEGYGIRWLLAIRRPDTSGPDRETDDFPVIDSFREVMPSATVDGG
ncbi:MAG TPA: haloacid dehalogenase, partial [Chromatiales bacterium]|nr:haloacid dehalogenase [Chromatiales bacterium]